MIFSARSVNPISAASAKLLTMRNLLPLTQIAEGSNQPKYPQPCFDIEIHKCIRRGQPPPQRRARHPTNIGGLLTCTVHQPKSETSSRVHLKDSQDLEVRIQILFESLMGDPGSTFSVESNHASIGVLTPGNTCTVNPCFLGHAR